MNEIQYFDQNLKPRKASDNIGASKRFVDISNGNQKNFEIFLVGLRKIFFQADQEGTSARFSQNFSKSQKSPIFGVFFTNVDFGFLRGSF